MLVGDRIHLAALGPPALLPPAPVQTSWLRFCPIPAGRATLVCLVHPDPSAPHTPPSHLAPFPGWMRPSGEEIQSHSSTSPSDRAKGAPGTPSLGLSGLGEQKTIRMSLPGGPARGRERGRVRGGSHSPPSTRARPGRSAAHQMLLCAEKKSDNNK